MQSVTHRGNELISSPPCLRTSAKGEATGREGSNLPD